MIEIIDKIVDETEKLIGKTGEEKKEFALDLITKLDDRTPLSVIPNELEKDFLSYAIDFAVALRKKHKEEV